jgi:phosphoserine phosphatase
VVGGEFPKDRERVTVAVAAFDFDGTLTTRDTVWPFLRCAAGDPAIWRGLPLAAPALVGRLGRLLGSTPTKEWLYRIYLRGRQVDDVVEAGRRFAREQVPRLVRPQALARLRWHQERGDRCLVVTASRAPDRPAFRSGLRWRRKGAPLARGARGRCLRRLCVR